MIYYMIRHKETGEFMPQLNRNRGYSHWNPNNKNSINRLHVKLTGTPRLIETIRKARACIAQWNCLPNGFTKYTNNMYEENSYTDSKPDGRKKEDLEIVIVSIEETGIIK